MAKSKGIRPSQLKDPGVRAVATLATKYVRQYLKLRRDISRLEAARKERVDKINMEYEEKMAPLVEEQNRLGGQLYWYAKQLIEAFGDGNRFVQLTSGKLSFRKSPDTLKITDEETVKRLVAARGWSNDCIKVEKKVKLDALKKKLSFGGVRRRMKGAEWVEGEDLLYIDDKVKIDRETVVGTTS